MDVLHVLAISGDRYDQPGADHVYCIVPNGTFIEGKVNVCVSVILGVGDPQHVCFVLGQRLYFTPVGSHPIIQICPCHLLQVLGGLCHFVGLEIY